MTLLQDYLRSGGTPESLLQKYAIKTSRHATYPNLVLFKYNQIDSPFSEQIVRKSRGIILDENNDWKVISRSFDKFFNEGEGHAANIDWKNSKVQEKVDGSLLTLYHYDNRWHAATTGTPDAKGEVSGFGFSFHDLFWKTIQPVWESCRPDENHCYFFELTSPFNRIVVRHPEASLTLLGGRNRETQGELTIEEASTWFPAIKAVREFPLTSFEEIYATFPSVDPLKQEGYVVLDRDFNRVKVKSPAYVALHHMADGLGSKKALLSIVLNGEITEVLNAFPEYQEALDGIKKDVSALVSHLEESYALMKDIVVQKDFAIEAMKTRNKSALFALRAKKTPDIATYLRNLNIDSVMQVLGYK